MTPEEVKARVSEIRKMADDDEVAHGREDRLYLDVLTAIANGDPNGKALAEEAIKAAEIEFSRWCA